MTDRSQEPLPEDLLPDSSIDNDQQVWDSRVSNLMTAAEPLLAEYRREPVPWWSVLAERFRPQLAYAFAAAVVLTLAVQFALPAPSSQPESNLPLATLAGEGDDATALWSIVNEEIDPVLALVILEGETP